MDIDSIVPLINMLPPQAQLYALNALGLFAVVWLGLLSVRQVALKLMGTPQATDSANKTRVYQALGLLDILTPTALHAMLEIARKEKVIRGLVLSGPPPVASLPPSPFAGFDQPEPETNPESPTAKRGA